MTTINNKKPVYIPSIEAELMYNMSVRGLENIMKYDYKGMIPFSLTLIKLRSLKGYSEVEITKNKKVKCQSDAIINVKFKNKLKGGKKITSFVRGYDNLMPRLNTQLKSLEEALKKEEENIKLSSNKREIEKLGKSIAYLNNKVNLAKGHIERIEADKDNEIYKEINSTNLRHHLYVNGFEFKGRKYVFFQRTASKSRQSQALWILEELYDQIKKWSHMGLDLSGKIDVGSLLAYSALTSSGIEDVLKINPKNIFIIDDRFSEFELPAIEVGNDLKAVHNKKAKFKNNIWDGQGLMDKSLFESVGRGNKGMALLRQHFFKSCMFSANIQDFLRVNCPPGKDFDKWTLTDMFGNKVAAKNVLVITTPSSLKFLKYAEKGKEKEAFENFKKRVKADKNLFGICKSEKSSKYDDYSFTSYQMINTLDADSDDIKKLAEFEVNYIESLQGKKDEKGNFNEQPFLEYLEKKKELTNAYGMLYKLSEINPEVVRTQLFRDYRTKQISNYRTKVKGGKIRVQGDYCTVVSSPYEMLLATINKFPEVVSHTLQGDEIYTSLHKSNEEYTLVRNPHNSQNNYYQAKNKEIQVFKDYFNFTKNIVVVNGIDTPVFDRLNGMDVDSDTVLIVKGVFKDIVDKTLNNRNYPVILNTIKSNANPVELTNENISVIDERTAKSQMWIGEVTNAAMYQMSVLWDVQNNEEDTTERQEKIDEIQRNIAVLVVLSNVAIDYSKKIVTVNVDEALRTLRKSKALKIDTGERTKKGEPKLKARNKPNFWKYVSSSDVEMEQFNCPMDILGEHIDSIEKGNYRKNLPMSELLIDMNREQLLKGGVDHKQIGDIITLVKDFDAKVKKINAESEGDKEGKKCQEKQTLLENAYNELDEKMGKKNIKRATMYKILMIIAEKYDEKATEKAKDKKKKNNTNDVSGIVVHLMNSLYRTHGQTFLNLFKK